MQFPSMAPLQGALPNVQPASGLMRTSSYGTPPSVWMAPQAPPYASALPPPAPSYVSAVPPSIDIFFSKKIPPLCYVLSANFSHILNK